MTRQILGRASGKRKEADDARRKIQRFKEELIANVHRTLHRQARAVRDLDEADEEALENLAEVQAQILFLESTMRVGGPLSEVGAAQYVEVQRWRNIWMTFLGFQGGPPWWPSAN